MSPARPTSPSAVENKLFASVLHRCLDTLPSPVDSASAWMKHSDSQVLFLTEQT